MIVTERQASNISCPYSKDFRAHDPSDSYSNPTCEGTRCMSWEWEETEYAFYQAYECTRYGWEFLPEIKPPTYTHGNPRDPEYLKAKEVFEAQYPDFDWFKENDHQMINAGWEMNPPYKFGEQGTRVGSRWRRLRPDRLGRCGRVHTVDIHTE